ncbi:MBL fold metallo-hydrolase [Caulobacter sp. KR2-114]|uniref:MBL fold metallo-hydrolase n=1 Tax=Caulobacter sp. KR2-114 TaxID=3400912 RepID=UPI003C11CF54
MPRTCRLALVALTLALASCGRPHGPEVATSNAAVGQAGASQATTWIELGTQSGPIPSGVRSEPAHLLLSDGQAILIDCGDGTSEQLAKAHVKLDDVHTILISHLHFDHTGGLFAFLGMRYQGGGNFAGPVTIYGPPGTRQMVDTLRQAMLPAAALAPQPPPAYQVIEVNDGSRIALGKVTVTAASNSHYALWQDKGAKPVSLAYRFDTPGRAIVYTGDTGPSDKVKALAKGADLLVSEIMDADTALATIKRAHPQIPGVLFGFVKDHFTKEHLLADQVGQLAAGAGVKALVLTHFGGAVAGDTAQIARLTHTIGQTYKGPVTFANDLDRF